MSTSTTLSITQNTPFLLYHHHIIPAFSTPAKRTCSRSRPSVRPSRPSHPSHPLRSPPSQQLPACFLGRTPVAPPTSISASASASASASTSAFVGVPCWPCVRGLACLLACWGWGGGRGGGRGRSRGWLDS
ncbi:hypothetical protein K505DRAFT_39585 [Melanomma pulvis-pyrius CBS 109.77]|uniref:Uncharacterized protein n=1 Tax=Melanomma pulvis-pyrius CBS 109.77 TaxID=1314802 RepID=A0A6A6XTW6_9PLEO|nr:hypothetical protein K505DRAFT_39585 [Melanomma pulvis-pyrius CBS 109.77]